MPRTRISEPRNPYKDAVVNTPDPELSPRCSHMALPNLSGKSYLEIKQLQVLYVWEKKAGSWNCP